MKTVKVCTSTEYFIKIGSKLLPSVGSEIASVIQGRNATIVSDNNVWPLYGKAVENSLLDAGFSVRHFIIPAGEASKNANNYLQLLEHLAQFGMDRNDCIIALGGGVVGDLAGFAAATYMRGIGYVQIPTSLLAMVDSSVGGKTGIDLPSCKNMVGAFYQPKLVICDIDLLKSLPERVFIDGCAEVIKYGVLFDPELFESLEQTGLGFHLESIVSKCIQWKATVVEKDEFDTGMRQMLNLGHTIGHAIEVESNYKISHGYAVAAGISIMSRAAVKLGLCKEADCQRIVNLLQRFHLPVNAEFSSDSLANNALSDKKRCSDTISLTLPATIGCCKQLSYPICDLEALIKAGM